MLLKPYFENITEKEYRGSDRVSYSLLKAFLENGPKALIEPQPEDKGDGLVLGGIVDKLLTAPNYNLYEDFRVTNIKVDSSGTTHTATLLKFLRNNPDIILNKGDEYTLKRVFEILEFKRPPALTDEFWSMVEVINWENTGIKCVSSSEVDIAEVMVNTFITHDYTKNIFSPPLDYEVINQAIIFFDYLGVKCKVMLDKVLVNHTTKVIYPFDIKTGWEFNFLNNFYKYKYPIQGAFYTKGLELLISSNKELEGYTIHPIFTFLYTSRENPELPVKYNMTYDYINLMLNGYTNANGTKIKGVGELLQEINWHKTTGNYETSKEIYVNSGTVNINTPVNYEQSK